MKLLSRNKLFAVTLLSFILFSFSLSLHVPKVKALLLPGIPDIPADCSIVKFGRCLNVGYFTGSIDRDDKFFFPIPETQIYNDPCNLITTQFGWAFPSAPCTDINNPRDDAYTETFIDTFRVYLAANCTSEGPFTIQIESACGLGRRRAIGSAAIINMMIGRNGSDYGTAVWNAYCGPNWYADCYSPKWTLGVEYAKQNFNQWADLVRKYNYLGQVRWNNFAGFGVNHLNSTGSNWGTDVQFFRNTDAMPAMVVEFTDASGNPLFQINRVCGNILGDPQSPPPPPPPSSEELSTNPTANTSLGPDLESPSTATFTSGITMVGGSYSVNVTREFYVKKQNGTIIQIDPTKFRVNPGALPLNNDYTGTRNPIDTLYVDNPITALGLVAGDSVCTKVTVKEQHIKREYNGTITPLPLTSANADTTGDKCDTFANRPYISAFGTDVSAGGGFKNGTGPCNQTSNIDTYISSNTGFGSGSQMAAFALGQINNFNSASLKTRGAASPLPTFGNGLAFSNQTSPFGQFTNNKCIHDYFADSADVSDPVPSNPMSLNAASGDYIHNGDLTITGGTVRKARHVRIFVNGNLTITGPISFEPDTPVNRRNNRTDIPSLVIVARNIKIDQSVPNLDGVYVAQPSAAQPNGGVIYTCTNGTNVYAGNEANLFDACKRQLVVNGSFVARHVQLLRTFGSIRNATNGEDPSDGARACNGALNGSAPVCAGEVFNFNPEIYLSLPIGDPDPNDLNGNYFNTVLPPIL